jgi:ferredoxin-NADP reductase
MTGTVQAGTVQAETVQAGTVQAGTVQAGTVQAETVRAGRTDVRPVRVRGREQAAADVVRLWLEPVDGGRLPGWEPGAHIDLVLGDGLVRQYSLCGDPADDAVWQVAVQLAADGGRGGSRTVVERLHPGHELTVRGPRNAFALRPSPRYLFVAGGIGITPLLPMVDRAEQLGADWQLVYGGRTRAGMPFLQRLQEYGNRVRVLPQDEAGLLPLAELVGTPLANTLVYCCGPAPLLDAIDAMMTGWPEGSLAVERFTTASTPRPPADADDHADDHADADDHAFEVELARGGRVITVEPGVSVLEALERAGVPMISSCREGTCGTCEVDVLDGEVDHRDRLLTPQERAANDTMMVCVSRCRGARLRLDV